jgi:hypothetical protein
MMILAAGLAYAHAPSIEARHLPIGFARSVAKSHRIPTKTRWAVGIIMPDFAVAIDPADDNPFGAYPSICGGDDSEGEQQRAQREC